VFSLTGDLPAFALYIDAEFLNSYLSVSFVVANIFYDANSVNASGMGPP
jgi:hypothetical protein